MGRKKPKRQVLIGLGPLINGLAYAEQFHDPLKGNDLVVPPRYRMR